MREPKWITHLSDLADEVERDIMRTTAPNEAAGLWMELPIATVRQFISQVREWIKLGTDVAERCECKTVGGVQDENGELIYHRDVCLPCRARKLLDREEPPEVS